MTEIKKSFQISPAQKWLLEFFDPPYEWYDRLSFTVNQSISKSLMETVIHCLIDRYEGLRTTFQFEGDQWHQKVNGQAKSHVLYLDKPLSADEELSICKTLSLETLPLFKVLMIKQTGSKTQVTFLFHHIIVDYISVMSIFNDFNKLVNGEKLAMEPPTNQDYIKALEAAMMKRDLEHERKFWEIELSDLDENSIKPSNEKYSKKIRKILKKEKAEKLLRHGKKCFGVSSLQEVISAPLYRALAEILSSEKVVVSHKLHGREIDNSGFRFFGTVGNFAINVPIICRLEEFSGWADLIQKLRYSLDALPLKGLTYDLSSPNVYPDHKVAQIRLNYMGNMSFHVPEGIEVDFLDFAKRLPHPNQPLTSFVEFFLFFCEKELYVDVLYDAISIDQGWMESLTHLYIHYLDAMIATIGKESAVVGS